MNQAPETFVVRFANGTAIQRFQEARDLVDEELESAPWSDNLRRAQECLNEAWERLSFALLEEEPVILPIRPKDQR